MFPDMSWLGILACVYALARLIHYAYLRLEDSNRHPFVQKVLIVFCFILWFISAPVTLIMGIINTMHYRRLEDKVRMDCAKDPSSHDYHKNASIPLEIISVFLLIVVICGVVQNGRLEDEIESLETQIEELEYECLSEYDRGFEAARDESFDEGYNEGGLDGYKSGYSDGRIDGAEAGYADGYDDGYGDGHVEGYDEGYSIGYGHALIDYCDKNIKDQIISGMLEFDSYTDIYEWLVSQRPAPVSN